MGNTLIRVESTRGDRRRSCKKAAAMSIAACEDETSKPDELRDTVRLGVAKIKRTGWPSTSLENVAVGLDGHPVPTGTGAGDPNVQICYF